MHRNYTSGYHSNNRIRYNRVSNTKTKTHYVVEEEYGDNVKLNVDNLYHYSVSNKDKKGYHNNTFKVNYNDCDDCDCSDYDDY